MTTGDIDIPAVNVPNRSFAIVISLNGVSYND